MREREREREREYVCVCVCVWQTERQKDSNLAQKEYKNIHDWVGKVVHWKLCKKLKFHRINKEYLHKLEPIFEN